MRIWFKVAVILIIYMGWPVTTLWMVKAEMITWTVARVLIHIYIPLEMAPIPF